MSSGGNDREIVSGTPKRIANVQADRMPTNQEGVVVPVVQGRGRLGLTWLDGALRPTAYKVKIKAGKKKETVGYNYYADVGAVVCMGPVSRITRIWAEEDIIWEGDITCPVNGYADIQTEIGAARFRFGNETQTQDGYIFDEEEHPAYAWQATLEFQQQYFGRDTTNARSVELDIERFPDVPESIQSINGSANPVGALYEALTDTIWGAGLSEDLFDLSSFETVGAMLAADGLGMSYVWSKDGDAQDVVDTILSGFKGALLWVPSEGKYKLAQGYSAPNTVGLLEIMAAECSSLPRVRMKAWCATPGEIRLDYIDRDRMFKESQILCTSQASLIVNDRRDTAKVSRREIDNQALALKVGQQSMIEMSLPSAEGSFEAMARTVKNLREGNYFKLELWPDAPMTVCRVIQRQEDAFSRDVNIEFEVDLNTWANSGGSGGSSYQRPDPATYEPVSHLYQRAIIAPRIWGNAVMLLAGRAHNLITGYGAYTSYAADSYNAASISTTDKLHFGLPVELVADPGTGDSLEVSALNEDAYLFEGVSAAEQGSGTLVLFIGDEIISLGDMVLGEDTIDLPAVIRGFADTKPAAHAIGEKGVIIYSASIIQTAFSSYDIYQGRTMTVKLPAHTLIDEQELDGAATLAVSNYFRNERPLEVASLSIGGEALPKPAHHYNLADAELDRSFTWGDDIVFDFTKISWADLGFIEDDFVFQDDKKTIVTLFDDEGTELGSVEGAGDQLTIEAPINYLHIDAVIQTYHKEPLERTSIGVRVGITLDPPEGAIVDSAGAFIMDATAYITDA